MVSTCMLGGSLILEWPDRPAALVFLRGGGGGGGCGGGGWRLRIAGSLRWRSGGDGHGSHRVFIQQCVLMALLAVGNLLVLEHKARSKHGVARTQV